MRIVEIRENSVSMGAAMRNAVIDFSKMTASAVAVVTDVVRDGKPIIGFGFNSNGRYAQGEVIRARLAPRILELTSEQQQNQAGDNLDLKALRIAMMQNEKPGGHGERAVAVAAVEIALWDAAAKIAGSAAKSVPPEAITAATTAIVAATPTNTAPTVPQNPEAEASASF